MRGKLLFEPSDSSRVTIIGDYSDREDNGQATPQLPGTTYSTRGFTGVAPLGSIPPAIVPYCTLESRSEEHTSELQSLMRLSYAVFCLKTNTTNCNRSYEQ